jgi:hypothetical protein
MRQLFIDARDKTSGTNASFTITLPQTLALSSGHQGRIDDLRLPVTTPTIYEGNNTIDFWVDGEYKTATIASGNYNGSDLATAIWNALAFAKAGSWQVNYNSVISMSIFYVKAPGY